MIGSAGKVTVTTAGTPVRATVNFQQPETVLPVHGFLVEALAANTGKIYVGGPGMNKSTLVGVYGIVAVPSFDSNGEAVALPTFSVALTLAPNALTLNDIWLDADDSGNGALVSYLRL